MPEKESVFKSQHKKILRDLIIDEDHPGTILRDFDAVLELFHAEKSTLTPALQLPLQMIATINDRLAHPLRLGLKRVSQKSYPHIQGLYLLIRASGMAVVDESGKKPVLTVDEDLYQQWERLNPADR